MTGMRYPVLRGLYGNFVERWGPLLEGGGFQNPQTGAAEARAQTPSSPPSNPAVVGGDAREEGRRVNERWGPASETKTRRRRLRNPRPRRPRDGPAGASAAWWFAHPRAARGRTTRSPGTMAPWSAAAILRSNAGTRCLPPGAASRRRISAGANPRRASDVATPRRHSAAGAHPSMSAAVAVPRGSTPATSGSTAAQVFISIPSSETLN